MTGPSEQECTTEGLKRLTSLRAWAEAIRVRCRDHTHGEADPCRWTTVRIVAPSCSFRQIHVRRSHPLFYVPTARLAARTPQAQLRWASSTPHPEEARLVCAHAELEQFGIGQLPNIVPSVRPEFVGVPMGW